LPTQQNIIKRYNAMLLKGDVAFMPQEEWESLITYFIQTDALAKAATAVNYAIEQHHFCSDFWLLKAQIHHDLGEPKNVIAAADRAEQLGVRSLDMYLLLSEAYIDTKDYTEALAVLHVALGFHQKDKSLAAIYLHIANIYEEQKRYDKVYETLRLAAQHNPNATEILDRLGAVVKLLGNYAESIVIHQNILDAQPYATRAWQNLATANAALGNTDAAIEAYEYALTIDESYANAAIGLAQIWLAEGLYERAKQVLDDSVAASDSENTPTELIYWQAFLQFKMEDFAQAKLLANSIVQQDPTQHTAHFLLGEMATTEQHWAQAARHYKQATAYANANGDYWAAYAHALMRSEQPETAAEAFVYAIKTDPQNLNYWLGAINTYFIIENYDAANDAIADAIAFTNAAQLGYCQTILYLLTRKRKAALQTLQQTLAIDLQNVDYLFDIMPQLVKDSEVLRLVQQAEQQAQQAAKRRR
jgi:tetratricopeptide (TPR) repeat protein